MRVFIDTNVVLDFLQERQPFVEDAQKIFELIDLGQIQGFIAATTVTNIYYIVRKVAGKDTANEAIAELLNSLTICLVDLEILRNSLELGFDDFEDAVQYACASSSHVDLIITRDLSGFAHSGIPVVLPRDFSL